MILTIFEMAGFKIQALRFKITLQPNGTYQLSVTSKHGRHGIPSFSGTCDISLDEIFELANGLRAWRNEPLYEKPAKPVEPAPPAPPAPNPFQNTSRDELARLAKQNAKGDASAEGDKGDSKPSKDRDDAAQNPNAKLNADVIKPTSVPGTNAPVNSPQSPAILNAATLNGATPNGYRDLLLEKAKNKQTLSSTTPKK